jgi:2-oxoglutarate ferredoxin oxidoreductase subunit delta
MKGKITIDQELCKGCGLCIEFCSNKLIKLSNKLNAAGYSPAEFNESQDCIACTSCALVCPEVAIEVYRG